MVFIQKNFDTQEFVLSDELEGIDDFDKNYYNVNVQIFFYESLLNNIEDNQYRCEGEFRESDDKSKSKFISSDPIHYLFRNYKIPKPGYSMFDSQDNAQLMIKPAHDLFDKKKLEELPKRKQYKNFVDLYHTILSHVIIGLEALSIPLLVNNGQKVLDSEMERKLKNTFPNAAYHLVPNLLNFINPGMSINWLMENLVEDGSFIMARPASFINISSIPYTTRREMKETDTVEYNLQSSLAIQKHSLNHASILAPHAYFSKNISRCTAYCLGPEEFKNYDWSKNQHIIDGCYDDNKSMGNDYNTEISPWIPLIAPPYQSANWWNGPISPVGRLAGHYESEQEFDRRFFNTAENDIKHSHVYTMNEVWTNMTVNINRCLLIEPHTYENTMFPLYKYVNYNNYSTIRNNAFKMNSARIFGSKSTENVNNSEFDLIQDRQALSRLYSSVTGTAIVKHCATTSDQISPINIMEGRFSTSTGGVVHTSKTNCHDYRIIGSLSIEKFDKYGVNHDLYY